ncbi:cell growth regulator with RING finger domain protein 1-like isoform X1 [Anopheles merus]|uniref:cell growth regulator with RING finger domain protein 1-like isoform X1 n=1 Tax=Anopheles merus TaxID=30066 RepID=UPI001BE456D6|nr:cell growth regulator with RING finger domain protein 1-like isoform X1 [Anopheles merus]
MNVVEVAAGFETTMRVSTSEVKGAASDRQPLYVWEGHRAVHKSEAAVILRVQADDVLRPSNVTQQNHNVHVPRLKMTRVHIPFTVRLLDAGNNSFDEVRLAVSSQVKYSLQAFWGVSIRELHVSLWRTWNDLRDASSSHIVDSSYCQQLATNVRCCQPHTEHVITLQSPKPPLILGAPPRLAYPLVVFMIRETEPEELLHPDETVILVNVVHLRDPVCPLPTSILAQYLKQASGQLSCLKQLYLATGDPMTADEATSSAANGAGQSGNGGSGTSSSTTTTGTGTTVPTGTLSLAEPVACAGNNEPLLCSDSAPRDCPVGEQLCVVCHYFPLSRALLPCRHTCICAVCFSKLDRCPMCRATISSYFCIRTEEYLPANSTNELKVNGKPKGTVHWLDALNDRLTDFLGFR